MVQTDDGRILISPTEVQRLLKEDAARGIAHHYLRRPEISATQTIKISTAALIFGEPPCADETVVPWADACLIFGHAADRLCAHPPPFDYPEPSPRTAARARNAFERGDDLPRQSSRGLDELS